MRFLTRPSRANQFVDLRCEFRFLYRQFCENAGARRNRPIHSRKTLNFIFQQSPNSNPKKGAGFVGASGGGFSLSQAANQNQLAARLPER